MRFRTHGFLLCLTIVLSAACAGGGSRPAPSPATALPPAPVAAAPAPAAPSGSTSSPAAAADRPALVAQPLNPPETVRVASIGLAGQAPTYLAMDLGYFAELGIIVELVNMPGTNEVVALLSGNQLDVGFGAISAGMYNAAARGVGVVMVAEHGGNIPGRSTPSLAIRSDILERKPWAGYQDLKGLKVAVQQQGTQTEYYLELMLQRVGLQIGDVELVALPFPDMAVAFANKGIDAAIYNEPWATQQEQQGIVKKVVYTDDVDPNGHVALLLYGETFARNTPAARNFMVAYLLGIRAYWDAYDGRIDFQHVVDVLQKYTPLKDEALIRRIPPTGQNPAGSLDPELLARYQDWYAERGLVPRKADMNQAIDRSFLEFANGVIGPYQPVEQPRRPS